jgi:hypothetical protein
VSAQQDFPQAGNPIAVLGGRPCACLGTTPSYPTYRETVHLPNCPWYWVAQLWERVAALEARPLAIMDDDPNDDGGERYESWCQGREDGRHRWMDGADFCEYCGVAWEDRNT